MSSSETSPSARVAANRRNALKSTGPRSEEGKARSRCNALKHGLTAQQLVLPTEDAAAFEERRRAWFDAYQPDGPAQQLLIDRAVQASWRLDRCAKAEAARLRDRVRHAADDFERAARDRAEELGRRLLFEPAGPGYRFLPNQSIWERADRRATDHPAILARALAATAQGVDWLLARWDELSDTLKTFGKWQNHEAYAAARLLGRRPEDSTDDPVVAMLILNGLSAKPGEVDAYDGFDYARRVDPGRPLDSDRVRALRDATSVYAKDALATLQTFIARETSRLRALKSEYLDDLAEVDRECAVDRAHFDDSPAAVLSRRYETACERELRRALGDAVKLPAPAKAADPASEPELEHQNTQAPLAEEAVAEGPPVAEAPARNEAKIAPPQPEPRAAVAPRGLGRMVDETPSADAGCLFGGVVARERG